MIAEARTSPTQYIRTIKPGTVQFLGPEYSFSEDMSHLLFKVDHSRPPQFRWHKTFFRAARAVRSVPDSVGVFPVENSSNAYIASVTRELVQGDLQAVGEAWLKIPLVLAGVGEDLTKVKRILSHSSPIDQARQFIDAYNLDVEEVDSTSAAAVRIRQLNDRAFAALCSPRAARELGLNVIAENVQDNPDNETRFMIVRNDRDHLEPSLDALRNPEFYSRKRKLERAKVVGIVSPERPRTIGMNAVLSFATDRGLEAESLGYLRHPRIPDADRDYFMEFEGHRFDLYEAFNNSASYESDMQFRLLGAYPVGELYDAA